MVCLASAASAVSAAILAVAAGSVRLPAAVDPALQAPGHPAEPLGGPLRSGGLGVPDELADERVGVDGVLDLRDVPALLEHDLGRVRKGVAHVSGEGVRHERILVAPDEHRRRIELPEAGVEPVRALGLLEIDVPGRGVERDSRVHRAIVAQELLYRDVRR